MIDIVIVVFNEELPILRVQAQSIDRFAAGLGPQNIYIMVNDPDSVARDIDTAWWGQYQDRVQIVPRSLFATKYVDDGWVSQQVLKLLGASLSYNTWSMVLDAKTLLVDHATADDFVANTYQLKLGLHSIKDVFSPSAQITEDLFGIKVEHVAAPGGVPFFFHNATVRQMIAHIENLTGESFPGWFQHKGMLTEFILYSGYVQYKHGNLGKIYLDNHQPPPMINICHSDVDQFENKLQMAKQGAPMTIGMHRRAWPQLTQQQQQAYIDYLISRGLDRARELS